MKVLFFSHQADFLYGGEICTLEFLRELARQGVEVHFASPPGPYFERARLVARCHPVPSQQFRRNWRELPGFALAWGAARKELQAIMRRERIDLLHATSLKAMVYAWGLGRDLSVIWHHHDILPAGLANGLWARALAKGAALVLVPSEATRRSLLEAGVPGERVRVQRNGLRREDWRVRGPRAAGARLRMALVGEISRRKGSDRLAGVLDVVEAQAGGRALLECLVIGEGLSDPVFASQIRAQLEPRGVRFLGRREDMKQLYSSLDLLLVLSRQDPLPTVIVEAGWSGVPVVGTRAGGIPEMVKEGVNGYLGESAEELGRAVLQVRENWESLSTGARRMAEERYDIVALTQELLRSYEDARRKNTGTRGAHGSNRE